MNILTGRCPIQRGTPESVPWLNETCPEWCESEHEHQHFADDRMHWVSLDGVGLSLHDLCEAISGGWVLDKIRVAILAPIGGTPYVEVWKDEWRQSLRLTAAEARELAALLILAALQAEEGKA